jgi:hypothetical protein
VTAAPRWTVYCLRAALAFVWLATGLGVVDPYYRAEGAAALAPLGLPEWVMCVTCAAEILLGLFVLFGRAATWLVGLQIAAIVTFSAVLSVSQPDLWLDTWGRLTKNLPLLVMLAALWLVEREGWTPRAVWLLRVGLAVPWLLEGLVHKMHLGHTTPWTTFLLASFRREPTPRNVALVGAAQVAAALLACRTGPVARTAINGQITALAGATLLASVNEPWLWLHPFGPLTKNVSWLCGTALVWWLARGEEVKTDER